MKFIAMKMPMIDYIICLTMLHLLFKTTCYVVLSGLSLPYIILLFELQYLALCVQFVICSHAKDVIGYHSKKFTFCVRRPVKASKTSFQITIVMSLWCTFARVTVL
jgi:hypothetical protein